MKKTYIWSSELVFKTRYDQRKKTEGRGANFGT